VLGDRWLPLAFTTGAALALWALAAANGYAWQPEQRSIQKSLICSMFPDGPGRIRTCDLGIKSPLLYQLSYRPCDRV
jgi:hypothetical protein